MIAKPPRSVLFVCLGNICRSPLAEGVFRAVLAERGMAQAFDVDSAGIGGWHCGSAPDPRSIAIAASHGVHISGQCARRIAFDDFARFDLILGMDRSNAEALVALAPLGTANRVHLFMEFAIGRGQDVPDPYYGGADGFAQVYRMIRTASEALAARLGCESDAKSGHASSTT